MDPLFLAVIIVALGGLLFMNWRTRKKQQAQLSFRDQLQIGQQVQTIGGLIGTVAAVEDDRVTIESTPGTQMVFLKQALARLIEEPVVETDEEELEAAGSEDDLDADATDDSAEESTEPGSTLEDSGAAVVSSPEVGDPLDSGASPEAGDDDTPRSTQN